MNTSSIIAAFVVVVSGLIWVGTQSNDTDWTGNRNQCVGKCYEEWRATHGGGIAEVEKAPSKSRLRRHHLLHSGKSTTGSA